MVGKATPLFEPPPDIIQADMSADGESVLAMTEIRFSNSLIEAWWRGLEHQWLFLHQLDSVARVR